MLGSSLDQKNNLALVFYLFPFTGNLYFPNTVEGFCTFILHKNSS